MLDELKEHLNQNKNLAFSEDSLQHYNKYKKVRFIKRFVVLVVLWSIIASYFILPISKVGTPSVEGIKNLTISDVIDIARLNSTDYLWENNTVEQVDRLDRHPLIKNVDITVNIFGVYIEIEETYPLARIQTSINCSDLPCFNYYLSDLSLVTGEEVFKSEPLSKAINGMNNLPILTNIENEDILNSILEQLAKIDYSIIENIISVSYESDYLASSQVDVIKVKISKDYLKLDANLILYVDMNRLSYKIDAYHLEKIAKYIKTSAKIDESNYCLSYLSNQTASCKESVTNR